MKRPDVVFITLPRAFAHTNPTKTDDFYTVYDIQPDNGIANRRFKSEGDTTAVLLSSSFSAVRFYRAYSTAAKTVLRRELGRE